MVPFCGTVVTASVELDCQDMEVELVLLAWVVGELGKVVTELDELVLLAWPIEELEEVVTEPDALLVIENGDSYSVST